ncbi:MAG: D-alanyl-D-alanine carboxypeptidase [Acidimicrobiales bacterium]|nr:D-alanyl-D-alanine carboxypeptidase [Acidimicrobiales bacterium]
MRPVGPATREMGVTDVAAVGAVTTTDTSASPITAAQTFSNVNLAEMIATRLSGGSSTLTSNVGATGQVASILRGAVTGVGSGGTGSLDVPPELLAYGNGQIPRALLTPIGIGQHRLWSVAANAFTSMRSDAAAQGVDISVTDSYRSYDQQVDLAARKGLWKDGGYAAVPGTSPHGWGLAVDLDVSPAGLAWVRANGAKYGFVETTPREPWHWEYRGAT